MIYKKQQDFPFLKEFKDKFAVTDKTIFVYREQADYPLVYFEDVIYCDYPLSSDLLAHEFEHLRSQQKIGAYVWVKEYLNNEEFRLEEELRAYVAQLKSIKSREDRAKKRHECALNLSSNLYGRLCTFDEALKLLTK